jgi:hypothetical protein
MTAPADGQLIGRGHTIETDLRHRGPLSLGRRNSAAAILNAKRAPSSTAC